MSAASSGANEPKWRDRHGATTEDGGVRWHCMKREMDSWDRERMARQFAAGCVMTLTAILFCAVGWWWPGWAAAAAAGVMFRRAR